MLKSIVEALNRSQQKPSSSEWNKQPLTQIKLLEGTPGPMDEQVTVPIYPMALRQDILAHNHEAGHKNLAAASLECLLGRYGQ